MLVKSGSDPRAEVIDGQQRLTTLSLLFATLRDLTGTPQLAAELVKIVVEPGEILAGTEPKPRLTLRKRDASSSPTTSRLTERRNSWCSSITPD